MTEPYKRVGRGGAGNYHWPSSTPSTSTPSDLEAQPSVSTEPPAPRQYAPTSTSTVSPYALSGRGGAGNWYVPATLAQTGVFSSTAVAESANNPAASPNTSPSNTSTSLTKTTTNSTTAPRNTRPLYSGRGGAGNYIENIEAERERERVEKEEAEKAALEKEAQVKNEIERDVEIGLQRPGKAYLTPGGVREEGLAGGSRGGEEL